MQANLGLPGRVKRGTLLWFDPFSEFAMNVLDTGQNNRLLPTAANSRYYRLVPF
jgi:hypothetical protein